MKIFLTKPTPPPRWPYLVDPDEQGTRWLQLHEAANELVVLREQDFNAPASRPGGGAVAQITLLEDALARCIPKGRPVLLMDLAGDPPSQLADLVARNTREEGEGGRGVLGTTRAGGGGASGSELRF